MNECNPCVEKIRIQQLELLTRFIRMRGAFERIVTPMTHKFGLTPVSAITLNLIAHQENATVSTVFKSLDLNQGNVSSMCKKLESEGFILRRRSKEDERNVVLEITDQGRTALQNIESEFIQYSFLCKAVTPSDLSAASEGINALIRLAEKIEHAISKKGDTTHNA